MPYHYAIFSALFTPHVGGVESYTENLAKELIAQGNTVTVVTSRLPGTEELELRRDGITVMRLPSTSFLGGRLPITKRNARYKELFDSLGHRKVERVVVNTRFYKLSLDGLRFAHELGLPVLLVEHGSAYLTLGNPVADYAIRHYENAVTKKVKSFNPCFAGVSEKCTQWLQHFGIKTHSVIPNAVDAPAFRACASGRNFRHEVGISPEDLIVVFVGRLAPEKGPDLLTAAVQYLNCGNIHFVFAGDGAMHAQLVKEANAYMHFLGSISKADLSALLQQADVFCLPSRSEGFCTSLLEAAACGMVPVITDVGGARELIPNSEYGFILQSREPVEIAATLQNIFSMKPAERAEMGIRLQARTEEQATWQNSVRALESVFLQHERS